MFTLLTILVVLGVLGGISGAWNLTFCDRPDRSAYPLNERPDGLD